MASDETNSGHASVVDSQNHETSIGPPHPLTISTWPGSVITPHPETAEILRQVEYYLGDENLPHDAHLLARTGGDGNGPVSINEILHFKKMRRFKPPAQVKASLKLSKVLEVINNKQIKRRYPLTVPLKVLPKLSPHRGDVKAPLVKDKPWLTKAMLKPTGFEEYATDGPIKPEEYVEDRKAFDPEESFFVRIENAVNRYMAKRKMHQLTQRIFSQFLIFGGMDAGQRQFGGGFDSTTLEEYDKDQIVQIKTGYAVSELVLDGIDEDDGEGSTVWSVDFISIARAFLSSRLLSLINWYDNETLITAINVPRNFYNYLLLHDVCPEYNAQLLEARRYCDLAELELPRLSRLDRLLPGDFNTACSTLYQGYYSGLHVDPASASQWAQAGDELGWTEKDAWAIFCAGLAAHGSVDQMNAAQYYAQQNRRFRVVRHETLGLEVVGIQLPQGLARGFYDHNRLTNTMIRPLGRLICQRWTIPHARPKDLPFRLMQAKQALAQERLHFLVNEDALRCCSLGTKMEVVIKTIDLGISWIDSIHAIYPKFFLWTANETIREWKEPGPPKEWMQRQNALKSETRALVRAENEADMCSGKDNIQPD